MAFITHVMVFITYVMEVTFPYFPQIFLFFSPFPVVAAPPPECILFPAEEGSENTFRSRFRRISQGQDRRLASNGSDRFLSALDLPSRSNRLPISPILRTFTLSKQNKNEIRWQKKQRPAPDR
jgi:hypothetical protein